MSNASEPKAYSLRTGIQCHAMDIRCVCALPNGGFVTGSRDKSCKAFVPLEKGKGNGFREVQRFIGAENYVSSICCLNTVNQTLIFVGSNDSNIYSYSLDNSDPIYKLMEHSGTVCALSSNNERGLIASGSWDQTCRVWSDKECKAVLIGHEAAVWTTAFIGQHVITGSADKTLKLWNLETKVECIMTFKGHTDCIRGIAVTSDTTFLSCSNDASIREWNIKGESIREFYGHENYIYSITCFAGETTFGTCSEDRTVRIWRKDSATEMQTIRLPATTLWSLASLSNNDLVIGSSTGKVYIYTKDINSIAKPEELKALEEELSKSTLHMSDIGDLKVKDLPTAETLFLPGKRDGQTKMVKDGTKVSVHSWDAAKNEWIKIGDVVGAAGATKDPTQKEVYNGIEYDYVFSIDIEDGVPPLKLPYNITDDPWTIAQKFIEEHNLSQLYLDQIANFITKNSSGMQITQSTGGQNCDPFTGGSSYSTQPNDSIEPMDTSSNENQSNAYFPQRVHLKFESVNIEGIAKKLKEFSDQMSPDLRLEPQDIRMLLKLSDLSLEVQPEQLRLIRLLLSWPKNFIFPALDLIRVSLLLPRINEDLSASKDSMRLIDQLLVCGTDANSTPNQIVAYRALSNLFSHPLGEQLALTHSLLIFKALSKPLSTNKNAEISLATVLVNFAVSYHKSEPNSALKFECFATVIRHLNEVKEPEAVFRYLVALGTLAENDSNIKSLLKSEDVLPVIKKLINSSSLEKVGKCAQKLLDIKS